MFRSVRNAFFDAKSASFAAAHDLPRLRNDDVRKVAFARWLRFSTVISNAWIADRLKMGH